MIYNKHNFDDNSEKIENLENKLNDLVQCLAQGYYPTKLVSAVRVTRALEIKKIKTIKVSVEELIDVYNNAPNILTNNAVCVSVASTTNNPAEINLNKSERGNYWIIATEAETINYWLLPNGEIDYQSLYKKLFNKYSINTLKTLFNFEEQQLSADKNLIIEQPAQVEFIPSGSKWKLRQPGSIKFTINDRSYQLKTLEKINQQQQELKSQIKQLTTENIQLKSSLKRSEVELKIIKEKLKLLSTEFTHNIANREKNTENKNYPPPEPQKLEFVKNPQIKTIPAPDKWQEVQLVKELTGHTSTIRTLAVTNWQQNNDKPIIISGSFDETIKIWSLNRGELIKSFNSTSKVNAIAVTPDGNSFISGGDDGKIQIWDISTASHRTIDAHSHLILAIAVSPDGKTIFTGSRDHSIKYWNYDTGKIRWKIKEGKIQYSLTGDYGTVIALDINRNFLASSTTDNIVRLWELKTYKLLPQSFQHSDLVWSVAISPDAQTLVCGCRDNTIRLWDISTGKLKYCLNEHSAEVWTVAINPNGQILASGSGDHTIKFWNLYTGQLLHTLESHLNAVYTINFSPDGKFLVSASKDKTIKIWRSSNSKNLENT